MVFPDGGHCAIRCAWSVFCQTECLVLNGIAIAVVIAYSLLLLHIEHNANMAMLLIGYAGIFLLAAGMRSTSSTLLSKHYYPPFKLEKSEFVPLRKFLKDLPRSNFGAFVTPCDDG